MLAKSFINRHLHCAIIILFTLSHNFDEKIGQEIIIIIIYLVIIYFFKTNTNFSLYYVICYKNLPQISFP